MTPERRNFTAEEIALIRAEYTTTGPARIGRILDRPSRSITNKARQLGLIAPSPAMPGRKFSSDEDRKILKRWPAISRRVAGPDSAKTLARDIGCTINQLRDRAAILGVMRHRIKEPAWTEEENELLSANVHLSLEALAKKLVRSGHPHRSESAISTQRHRLGAIVHLSTEAYSATGLSGLLGCSTTQISAWIRRGWLKATPRSEAIDRNHGGIGDRWMIAPLAVKNLITTYPHYIDITAVDKHWFIDLLAGSAPRTVLRQESAGYREAE